MAIYVGTSGWSYDHWHGVLYPHGLPARERLDYYLRAFATAELNSSYYHWPRRASFYHWRRRLPENFRLSVKAPGLLTHVRRLYSPEGWVARMRRDLWALGLRYAVLLVQLPPTLAYDYERLAWFLQCVPDEWRVTVEFRHPSWHREEVFALLERHGAAYCIMSGAHLPCILRATASFVYVRLHGPDTQHLYGGSYSDQDLYWWAERIREWQRQGRDVYAYFNNDGGGNAVRNAQRLKEFLWL
ncbi:Uncharacterized conserved protein YecE, DUF72 family [Catalinimonas alkaloidigena]|uniref:Uncharacterized conserved protein YecE, DUF72 family n=1 Tax=Catalinimonas alkaloidigena TaxID=1075417 RepID=A0A1G9RIY7_9BACT|nr:DUF72 domain-containing protein [Catalinimonas alkaloidigena]SDM23289.1 Uncharacterized conserved protein YecE, DUF72 family [Catalinimonas alkaloidigena]